MKLSELLKDTDVLTLAAPSECEIGGVSYDSRKVKPGDAFVAISGFETDGYKYIPSAVEKGAAVVISDRVPQVDRLQRHIFSSTCLRILSAPRSDL